MKNWLLFVSTFFIYTSLHAQLTEENVFGHYILNPVLINPGATGFQETHLAQMNIKSAWAGFDGAPKTYGLNYNGAFGDVLGLGASVRSENAASLNALHIGLNYAVRFKPTDDFKIAAGLSTEFTTIGLSEGVRNNDMLSTTPDPIIDENIVGTRYFDMAAGVYGAYKENTFFSLSFPNVVRTRLNTIVSSDTVSTNNAFSFIFHVGHRIGVKDQDFSIEPSLLVLKMGDIYQNPLQLEFNLLARFLEESLAAGLSYR
ncbi:MAG: PorP/SprF family type IX secretion system membrane protein, partial [Bacteroidota bacterium]